MFKNSSIENNRSGSIPSTLNKILRDYGNEIFYDEKRCCSLIMDLTDCDTSDINLIKVAFKSKVYSQILNSDPNDYSTIEKSIIILKDNFSIEVNSAIKVVNWLLLALDRKLFKEPGFDDDKKIITNNNVQSTISKSENITNEKTLSCTNEVELDTKKMLFYDAQGLLYLINNDGAIVCGIKSKRKVVSIIIPESIVYENKFYNVVAIAKDAFKKCEKLVNVKMPSNLKTIGNYSFAGCISLSEIDIPNNIVNIESFAFDGCTKLNNLKISNSLLFGENAFNNCNSLKIVYIDKLQVWCDSKFENQYSNPLFYGAKLYVNGKLMTDYIVPLGITEINPYILSNYKYLEKIHMADTVKNIGTNAFSGCSKLNIVKFSRNLVKIGDHAFENCHLLEDVYLSDFCVEVGEYAFKSCDKIKNFYLGKSLQIIGSHAFDKCLQLHEIRLPSSLLVIENSAFMDCMLMSQIYIPNSVYKIGPNAFIRCNMLKIMAEAKRKPKTWVNTWNSSNCVVKWGSNIDFENQTSILQEINYDKGTAIPCESENVHNCDNEFDIIVDEGKAIIKSCKNMKIFAITIPEYIDGYLVTGIGNHAFCNCKYLTRVIMADSIVNIGKFAFCQCSQLKNIVLSKNLQEIGESAFYGCVSLEGIELPSRLKKIGKEAFRNCKSISNIILPKGLKRIDTEAFRNCMSLKQIAISKTITFIGDWAFYGCKRLIIETDCNSYYEPKGWQRGWNTNCKSVKYSG